MRIHCAHRSSASPSPSSSIRPLPHIYPSVLTALVLIQILPRPCLGATVNAPAPVPTSLPPNNVSNLTLAFPEIAARVPACGLSCVIELAPNRSCFEQQQDGGQSVQDCLCAEDDNDLNYYPTVLKCVQKYCTMEESVETARGAWKACGKNGRWRKAAIWAPLSIEIPALFCALLRLYSRWWSVSKFEMDDYIIMMVVLLFIPFEVLGIYAAQSAFGRDIWTVQASRLTISFKLFYVGESFYLAILALTKMSILCFYLRIFPNPTFRAVAYVILAWVAVSAIVSIFVQIFQCTPIDFIWEGWKKGEFGPYKCLDVHALGFATAAMSIAQDIAIIIMPLPLLAKLNVSRRCKLGIMIMFSLGVFVLITSCIRLWSLYSFGESANPTWDYTDVIIWTGLEVAVSIIVISLPAIRVLVNRRMPGVFGSVGGGIWGPNGEYRGYGRSHASTTSSFGNTTFVGSMYSTMPVLKRLSAISHVSSLKVERLTGSTWADEEMGTTSQAIDFGEKGSHETKRTESDSSTSHRGSSLEQESQVEPRPLPYPPRTRPLPQPPAPAPAPANTLAPALSLSRPRGPRPMFQPDGVKALRRGGLIVPLPNIADVLSAERSAESLPAELPAQESHWDHDDSASGGGGLIDTYFSN